MNSPIVLGNRPPCASLSGSRPVISSRRATRIAKQSESSPESLRGSASVSGGSVFFWLAATVWISFRIVARKDIVVFSPWLNGAETFTARGTGTGIDKQVQPQNNPQFQGSSCRCATVMTPPRAAKCRMADIRETERQNPDRHQRYCREANSSIPALKGARVLRFV